MSQPNPNQVLLLNPIPETIKVVLTETDRQTANKYSDPWGCIICTALMRMGYAVNSVIPFRVYLQGSDWIIPDYESNLVSGLSFDERYIKERPFYEPGIVGIEIQLQRCNELD